MVIDQNSSTLQAQLQAQLRATQDDGSGARRTLNQRADASEAGRDTSRDRLSFRGQDDASGRSGVSQRALEAGVSRRRPDISSDQDIAAAQNRVQSLEAGDATAAPQTREAPVGRLSAGNDRRDVPLGQIVDLRV